MLSYLTGARACAHRRVREEGEEEEGLFKADAVNEEEGASEKNVGNESCIRYGDNGKQFVTVCTHPP